MITMEQQRRRREFFARLNKAAREDPNCPICEECGGKLVDIGVFGIDGCDCEAP